MYDYYCSVYDMLGFLTFMITLVQLFFAIVLFVSAYILDKKVKLWRFLIFGTNPFGFIFWIYLFIRDKGKGDNAIQKFLINENNY